MDTTCLVLFFFFDNLNVSSLTALQECNRRAAYTKKGMYVGDTPDTPPDEEEDDCLLTLAEETNRKKQQPPPPRKEDGNLLYFFFNLYLLIGVLL